MNRKLGWVVVLVTGAVGFSLSLAGCPAMETPEPEAASEPLPELPIQPAVEAEASPALDSMEAGLNDLDRKFKELVSLPAPACPELCAALNRLCAASGNICTYSNEHFESMRAAEVCGRSRTLCIEGKEKALTLCGPCAEGS